MIYGMTPFRHWHLAWLEERGDPMGGTLRLSPAVARVLEYTNSWTGHLNGDPVFSLGTIEQWPGRHTCWAWLGPWCGRHMTWITREAENCLAKANGRIEMTVRADFAQGQRWAKMLGFKIETPRLKTYGPDGEDHIGFVRFR